MSDRNPRPVKPNSPALGFGLISLLLVIGCGVLGTMVFVLLIQKMLKNTTDDAVNAAFENPMFVVQVNEHLMESLKGCVLAMNQFPRKTFTPWAQHRDEVWVPCEKKGEEYLTHYGLGDEIPQFQQQAATIEKNLATQVDRMK